MVVVWWFIAERRLEMEREEEEHLTKQKDSQDNHWKMDPEEATVQNANIHLQEDTLENIVKMVQGPQMVFWGGFFFPALVGGGQGSLSSWVDMSSC